MNLLSALAPTSIAIDPVEGITGNVALTAAGQAAQAQHQLAKEVVQLLDPAIGRHLNVAA